MPSSRQELLRLLAYKSFRLGEFKLSSGATSDYYIDCRTTTLDAKGSRLTGEVFVEEIRTRGWKPQAIGGLTMGADPLASAVATVSYLGGRPLDAFYVRKEAKGHGTAQWLEGRKLLRPGMQVAILEDVVTTGGSALKEIARAREFGLKVSLIVGLVDREEGGREALEQEAPLQTLFRRREFI